MPLNDQPKVPEIMTLVLFGILEFNQWQWNDFIAELEKRASLSSNTHTLTRQLSAFDEYM
jgi:hypothetical protein